MPKGVLRESIVRLYRDSNIRMNEMKDDSTFKRTLNLHKLRNHRRYNYELYFVHVSKKTFKIQVFTHFVSTFVCII